MWLHIFVVILGIAAVNCRPNSISDNVDVADANSELNGTLDNNAANFETTTAVSTKDIQEQKSDVKDAAKEPDISTENKTNIEQTNEQTDMKVLSIKDAEPSIDDITTSKENKNEEKIDMEKLVLKEIEKLDKPEDLLKIPESNKANVLQTKEQTVTEKAVPSANTEAVAVETIEKAAKLTENTTEKSIIEKVLHRETEKLKHIKDDIERKLKKFNKNKNIAENNILSLKEEFLKAVADRIHNIKVISHGGRPRIVPANDKPKKLLLNYSAQNINYSPVSSHFANIQMIANRYKHLPSTGTKLGNLSRFGNTHHKGNLQHTLAELEEKLNKNSNKKDASERKIPEIKGLEKITKIKKIVSDVLNLNGPVKDEILPENKKVSENKNTPNDSIVASNAPVTIANDNIIVSTTTEPVLTKDKNEIDKKDIYSDRKKINYDEIKHADGYSTFIATKNKSDEAKPLKNDTNPTVTTDITPTVKAPETNNKEDLVNKPKAKENSGVAGAIENKESKTKTIEDLTSKSDNKEPTASKPNEEIESTPKPEIKESTTIKSLESTPEAKETTREIDERVKSEVKSETGPTPTELPDIAKGHIEPIYNRAMKNITPIEFKTATPKSIEIASSEVTTAESIDKGDMSTNDASKEGSVESANDSIELASPNGNSDSDVGLVGTALARLASADDDDVKTELKLY